MYVLPHLETNSILCMENHVHSYINAKNLCEHAIIGIQARAAWNDATSACCTRLDDKLYVPFNFPLNNCLKTQLCIHVDVFPGLDTSFGCFIQTVRPSYLHGFHDLGF